jgi:hypothetical protein
MKKYLFLLFALVAMSSCEPKPAIILERTEEEIISRFDVIRHYEYQNHRYISFQYSPSAYKSFMGVVHDPECPCHKK